MHSHLQFIIYIATFVIIIIGNIVIFVRLSENPCY